MENKNTGLQKREPKEIIELVQKLNDSISIVTNPIIKERWIQNYNQTHKDKYGEIAYNEQMAYWVGIINAKDSGLKLLEPMSVFIAFNRCARMGYSVNPADKQVYVVNFGGKLTLKVQAEAHVSRLRKSKQIKRALPVQIVYEGDLFKINMGVIIAHEPSDKSTEKIKAAYVRFILPDNSTLDFPYYPKDWEGWRAKSPLKDGSNWNWKNTGQPEPNFLKKKILGHAANDGSWFIDESVPNQNDYAESEVEDTTYEEVYTEPNQQYQPEKSEHAPTSNQFTPTHKNGNTSLTDLPKVNNVQNEINLDEEEF